MPWSVGISVFVEDDISVISPPKMWMVIIINNFLMLSTYFHIYLYLYSSYFHAFVYQNIFVLLEVFQKDWIEILKTKSLVKMLCRSGSFMAPKFSSASISSSICARISSSICARVSSSICARVSSSISSWCEPTTPTLAYLPFLFLMDVSPADMSWNSVRCTTCN